MHWLQSIIFWLFCFYVLVMVVSAWVVFLYLRIFDIFWVRYGIIISLKAFRSLTWFLFSDSCGLLLTFFSGISNNSFFMMSFLSCSDKVLRCSKKIFLEANCFIGITLKKKKKKEEDHVIGKLYSNCVKFQAIFYIHYSVTQIHSCALLWMTGSS